MQAILSIDKASVFYDGIFDEPARLAHPEGVAVDSQGNVWCGTETGDIMRIAADASRMERIATTGGFITGIAFDDDGHLFICDIRDGYIYRLDLSTRKLGRFGETKLNIPNYPVVDLIRNVLYVSDSYSFEEPGPGIWRFDLATGVASLWYKENIAFANGMAMGVDGNSLFVVESKCARVLKINIGGDGSIASSDIFVENVLEFPDGLALDTEGNVYISCYEPSRVYRASPDGKLELFIKDKVATLIAHPTNMAFRGSTMFTTNLGRWHITRIDTPAEGAPVPYKK